MTITIDSALLAIVLILFQLHTPFLGIASQLERKVIRVRDVGVLLKIFHGLVR